MNDTKIRGLLLLSGMSSMAAYATQPPDSVQSDSYYNTASGTNALYHVQPSGSSGFANSAFGSAALLQNDSGYANAAVGTSALFSNTSGFYNTAVGAYTLSANTTGTWNTAVGSEALSSNTLGYYNAALGAVSLYRNTTGVNNTATGAFALKLNTTGNENTAAGAHALHNNSTASDNSALGYQALYTNTTGTGDAAVGANALYSNTTGVNNTAFGYLTLYSNTTGKGNAGQGTNALYNNTTGIRNLGIGNNALFGNTTGSYNIALGFDAGYNLTSGSSNIEIGTMGTAGDNNTIQIGVQGTQSFTSIAGIFGTQVSGSAVYVTSTGQLGVQASSERYKTDIATMATLSARLEGLRPVTFHYKTDPDKVPQYGLIAEEVAVVYPELVIRDAGGKIMGVHYEELAPMLLNEVQRQQRTISAQAEHAAGQDAAINALTQRVQELAAQVEHSRDVRGAPPSEPSALPWRPN